MQKTAAIIAKTASKSRFPVQTGTAGSFHLVSSADQHQKRDPVQFPREKLRCQQMPRAEINMMPECGGPSFPDSRQCGNHRIFL